MLHCGEVKKEKTLATGRNILIAVCICKLFCGKGWKFIESLEYQPDWKLVSVFDHHIPECGLSSSVCVCVCVCVFSFSLTSIWKLCSEHGKCSHGQEREGACSGGCRQ